MWSVMSVCAPLLGFSLPGSCLLCGACDVMAAGLLTRFVEWMLSKVIIKKCFFLFVFSGGVQLICNNMVTSTRAIVNTARSMVSTIMKFLDSGPSKTSESSLKARVLVSEPDNAEGIHNFAPLGICTFQLTFLFLPR